VDVTANFAPDTFTLTYTLDRWYHHRRIPTNGQLRPRTARLVTAVPDTGFHFVDWSDGILTAARTDLDVTANVDVTANFAPDTFTLTYTAGTGVPSPRIPQTVSYGEDGTLVTAVPDTGFHFVDWSDGILTAARTDLDVTANVDVTANFAPTLSP